jgi:hypothetical protein
MCLHKKPKEDIWIWSSPDFIFLDFAVLDFAVYLGIVVL